MSVASGVTGLGVNWHSGPPFDPPVSGGGSPAAARDSLRLSVVVDVLRYRDRMHQNRRAYRLSRHGVFVGEYETPELSSDLRVSARRNPAALRAELAAYPFAADPLTDALTCADQAAGPAGERLTVAERLADTARRQDPAAPTSLVRDVREPYILAAAARTERRLRSHGTAG